MAGLLGVDPTPQSSEPSVQKPQHPSANYYQAPVCRGENHADLTDDERSAESVDRSEIDEASAMSNLCEAMSFVGTGGVMTLGLSAFSNPGFGLGVSLVGCLVFGTGITNKNGKANLVRTGAMSVGAGFGVTTVVNQYQQNDAIATINTSIEQFVVPKKADGSIPIEGWLAIIIAVFAVGRLFVAPPKGKKKAQASQATTSAELSI